MILRYFCFVNEEHGVSTRDVSDALGEASKFVSITCSPKFFLCVKFYEVSVLHSFTCSFVNDSKGNVVRWYD